MLGGVSHDRCGPRCCPMLVSIAQVPTELHHLVHHLTFRVVGQRCLALGHANANQHCSTLPMCVQQHCTGIATTCVLIPAPRVQVCHHNSQLSMSFNTDQQCPRTMTNLFWWQWPYSWVCHGNRPCSTVDPRGLREIFSFNSRRHCHTNSDGIVCEKSRVGTK